ncbi:MAG: Fur family transcriptional regulator [Bacilli bacterium]
MQERTTKQKEFIKEYLKNSYIHPTAFDVLKSAKENNINIGLTSIYRILNKMVEKQEAFSIITKDNIVHYDINRGDHYHFICTSCHNIIDLDYDIEVFMQLEKRYKINFSSIQDVHIYGLCPDCEKSN